MVAMLAPPVSLHYLQRLLLRSVRTGISPRLDCPWPAALYAGHLLNRAEQALEECVSEEVLAGGLWSV